jgi:hypothetical protein
VTQVSIRQAENFHSQSGGTRLDFRRGCKGMKKYWHVIGIGIQNNLTYRVNYLARTLFSFIPLFAMLSVTIFVKSVISTPR